MGDLEVPEGESLVLLLHLLVHLLDLPLHLGYLGLLGLDGLSLLSRIAHHYLFVLPQLDVLQSLLLLKSLDYVLLLLTDCLESAYPAGQLVYVCPVLADTLCLEEHLVLLQTDGLSQFLLVLLALVQLSESAPALQVAAVHGGFGVQLYFPLVGPLGGRTSVVHRYNIIEMIRGGH